MLRPVLNEELWGWGVIFKDNSDIPIRRPENYKQY